MIKPVSLNAKTSLTAERCVFSRGSGLGVVLVRIVSAVTATVDGILQEFHRNPQTSLHIANRRPRGVSSGGDVLGRGDLEAAGGGLVLGGCSRGMLVLKSLRIILVTHATSYNLLTSSGVGVDVVGYRF